MAKHLPPTLPDASIAPRYEVASNQDLGAYVKNRSESESLAVMDRVSRTGLLDDFLN
jgi:hypothetical protein